MYQVYILECADGTLYTGIAIDADQRLLLHNRGRGAKYTKGRLPVRLRYRETCADKGDALRRELQIKALSRERKLSLIAHFEGRPTDGEYAGSLGNPFIAR
ncbi:MAG: GIY-YIG nuclease family protein [Clostridiales bacterium]